MEALDVYRESSLVHRESSAIEDTRLSVALVDNVVPNMLYSSWALKPIVWAKVGSVGDGAVTGWHERNTVNLRRVEYLLTVLVGLSPVVAISPCFSRNFIVAGWNVLEAEDGLWPNEQTVVGFILDSLAYGLTFGFSSGSRISCFFVIGWSRGGGIIT